MVLINYIREIFAEFKFITLSWTQSFTKTHPTQSQQKMKMWNRQLFYRYPISAIRILKKSAFNSNKFYTLTKTHLQSTLQTHKNSKIWEKVTDLGNWNLPRI